MSREIALTKGKVAEVDDCDYPYLAAFKWFAMRSHGSVGGVWYAARTVLQANGRNKTIMMHREVLSVPAGMLVDHIDGDGLNNRRNNLRACTKSQNQYNKGLSRNNTSGYRGVNFDKTIGKWHAQIQANKGNYIHYSLDMRESKQLKPRKRKKATKIPRERKIQKKK